MDEARRVLNRLDRIEALKAAGAARGALLGELRALLREGEAWAAAEGEGAEQAAAALAGLGSALAGPGGRDERDRGGEEVVAGRAAV